ncbi:MAG: 4-vinyl reductase [Oscillospiraceae bacterium]|nr:4-vinyl reductase [Oscillospiraceae bacterium]
MSDSIFAHNTKHTGFTLDSLGDVAKWRGGLWEDIPLISYRLMQYSMLSVLTDEHGLEQANEYFRRAGHLAGLEFAENTLLLDTDFNTFVFDLQTTLKKLKIGILHIDSFDPDTYEIACTVCQDCDCGDLPVTNENVRIYDEGFIAGILEAFTGISYRVRKTNCCCASGVMAYRFSSVSSLDNAP